MTSGEGPALRHLARLWGVQTAYNGVDGRRRVATRDALLAVLKALGAPLDKPSDIPKALRETEAMLAREVLEPVVVVWQGRRRPSAQLRLLRRRAEGLARCRLRLDSGEEREWELRLEELTPSGQPGWEGEDAVTVALPLPEDIPLGYHGLSVALSAGTYDSVVLCAPRRAFDPGGRKWGLFLPLYALRSRSDWGVGDIDGLRALTEWAGSAGAGFVALLPLLPAFLEEPFDPSPYAPVSRLFWNELYISLDSVPELAACAPARAMVASPGFQAEIAALRDGALVEYRRVASLKRRALSGLAQWFFVSGDAARWEAYHRFLRERPEVQDYARFRAACETYRLSWRRWPEGARDGSLDGADVDITSERYHLYVQWICHDQLMDAGARQGATSGLLFDLPLGVHRDGYDTWRYRDVFVEGVSAGAPPDTFFPGGQDWGFPPPHPQGMRRQGYRYWRAALGHHLVAASALRIDHVMGLHRLYWVPDGMDAREGVYVRYPSEEMYAVLCIESARHRALIVGEDLGTVPRAVTRAMARRGVHRTYVLQYEAPAQGVPDPPERSVASLNTHDMAPFAAFWDGLDIADQAALGLLTPGEAAALRRRLASRKRALLRRLRESGWLPPGPADTRDVALACLRLLAGSKARTVLVNLEDLWGETQPQNVPGTREERPNWRRRARYAIEDVEGMEDVGLALREVQRLREAGGGP